MSCEDIPSLLDLQNIKHIDDFGRLMGTGTGTSTNEVTGQVRSTYNAVMANIGIQRIGDFTTGCTVTERNQGVLYETNGTVYVWIGALPKIVPPSSSPETTGGISPSGDWIDVGDASLRSELSAPGGVSLVGNAADNRESIVEVSSIHKMIGSPIYGYEKYLVSSYLDENDYGGGVFKWMPLHQKQHHNGITIIDPAKQFPLTTDDDEWAMWFTPAVSGTGVFVKVDGGEITALRAGVVKNVNYDQTAKISALLSLKVNVSLGGKFSVMCRGLDISNDIEFNLSGGEIKKVASSLSVDHLIRFKETSDNITVRNGILTGDALTHLNGVGEGVHNLFFYPGCKNITIIDVETNEAFGDGVYLGDFGSNPAPKNNKLIRVKSRRCRRQGLSITSCDGFDAIDCDFGDVSDSYSPWPLPNGPCAGVDIEPNTAASKIRGLHIRNLKTSNCRGFGLYFYFATKFRSLTAPDEVTITIDGHHDDGSMSGFGALSGNLNQKVSGFCELSGQQYSNNKKCGVDISHWTVEIGSDAFSGPRLTMHDPVVVNYGRSSTSSVDGTGILLYNNHPSGWDYGSMSGVDILRPSVVDFTGEATGFAMLARSNISGRQIRNSTVEFCFRKIKGVVSFNEGAFPLPVSTMPLSHVASVTSNSIFGSANGAVTGTAADISNGVTLSIGPSAVGSKARITSMGSGIVNASVGVSLRNSSGGGITTVTMGSGGFIDVEWITTTVVSVRSTYGNVTLS